MATRRDRRLSKDADPHVTEEAGARATAGGGGELLLRAGEVGDPHLGDLGAESAISNTQIVGAYSCQGMNHSRPKANQDCGCVAHPLGGDEAAVLLAVYDGHGPDGTAVSQHILQAMHFELEKCESEKLRRDPAAALAAAFKEVQEGIIKLSKQPGTPVDGTESGACSLVAYLRGSTFVDSQALPSWTLWVANAGDCVAVLARTVLDGQSGGVAAAASAASDVNGVKHITGKAERLRLESGSAAPAARFSAIKLSTAHKPNLPNEQKRIESMGGWVRETEYDKEDGEVLNPARFYRQKGEANRHKGPGLAISRSIGDLNATKCGMTAEPEVIKHELRLCNTSLPKTAKAKPSKQPSGDGTEEDAFLIFASDGVWEFLSAQDAVDIVAPVYAKGGPAIDATKRLIDRAKAEWLENDGDFYRDDITALVVFVPRLLEALHPH